MRMIIYGILDDNRKQESSYINVGNACSSFNIYGVEWTPLQIKFFLNGNLRSVFSNINNHEPMGIILNLAIGGCYGGCGIEYCGGLNWEYSSNCSVSCNTQFPSNFEIDWVRCWQKTNQALYIKGVEELCLGDSYIFKAPNYPNASYAWSGTSGLVVTPFPWLNFDGGIWRAANITALAADQQTVSLIVTFPSGYVETLTYNINVQPGIPALPSDVIFKANEVDCCYEIYTPIVIGATSYIWNINNYEYSTTTNYSNDCIDWGPVTVFVKAKNSCGVSSNYTETTVLPRLSCWHPLSLKVYPNPSHSTIKVEFKNHNETKVQKIKGHIFLRDKNGSVLYSRLINENLIEIDVRNFKKGLYFVVFKDGDIVINKNFIILD